MAESSHPQDGKLCDFLSGHDKEETRPIIESMEKQIDLRHETTSNFPESSSPLENQTGFDLSKASPHLQDETAPDSLESPSYLKDESVSDPPMAFSNLEDEIDSDPLKSSSHLENEAAPDIPKSPSHLENLPAELRFLVLSWMPDLPTLHSLVHASPVLHAQYREHRDTLLLTCLSRELDGYYVDAYATLMSRVAVLGRRRTDELCEEFLLKNYDVYLSGSKHTKDLTRPSGGQIRWMAAFHDSVARPIARLYAKWALENLCKAAASETSSISSSVSMEDAMSLTRSEEIRVYRAIYRFETYCHLFGHNKGTRVYGFRGDKICDIFFGMFDPWDVEALASIYSFVKHKYDEIFDEVKEDVSDTNPRFRNPSSGLTLFDSWDLVTLHDEIMSGTAARGLRPLMRLLLIKDHEALVEKTISTFATDRDIDECLDEVLGWASQHERRLTSPRFPTARDKLERKKASMEFTGDGVPPISPPLAWVLLWNGKYSNVFGGFVPGILREWGYVMWDEQRWNNMGAKNLVNEQWKLHPESLVETMETIVHWDPIGGAEGEESSQPPH
ncbi:hypothetical protein CORC01_02929 [Colletotrichum orchidophilum]|uniref:Uncharacterized protein n=1 Tax=Colletotrichum orchidophilum TaxID=1209926 RepID=A0A1G4BKB0_9PEZI|nr:uncharacterized protein CORC01_02929 [Colletotrichum orchidophilum]OHF01738.1 hypothetical protein CORC01_02929 [Colletotrichum orchidophilum]